MLDRHPVLKKAVSLLLSFAIVLPASLALVGDSGRAAAVTSLPYIEELKASKGGAFNILEIAPAENEGTIGYYIAGAEPCANFPAQVAAKMVPQSSGYGDRGARQNEVNQWLRNLQQAKIMGDYTRKAASASTDAAKHPLTQTAAYAEKYPWEILSSAADYPNELTLPNYIDKVDNVTGIKFEAFTASTSQQDITAYAYKDATTYKLDPAGKYVQDIAYYTSDADEIARLIELKEQVYYYSLTFAPVTFKDGIPSANGAALANGTPVYANYSASADGKTIDSTKYTYYATYSTDEGAQKLDTDQSYFVITGTSAPQAASSGAAVYAAVPQNNGFKPAASGQQGYFSPASGTAIFRYVGAGQGTYKCTAAAGSSEKYTILTDKLFYNTCYINNEWFKKYVLNCDFDANGKLTSDLRLNIQVTVKKPQDVSVTDVQGASLLYLSYGMSLNNDGEQSLTDASYAGDITAAVKDEIAAVTTRSSAGALTPVIVDSRLPSLSNTGVPNLKAAAAAVKGRLPANANANENLYLYSAEKKSVFATNEFLDKLAPASAYTAVSDEISVFNTQRAAQGSSEKLDDTVSMAAVVRYIINASAPLYNKGTVRVLDIEPAKSYSGANSTRLTASTVKNTWLKGTSLVGLTPEITTWSTAELIGRIDEIGEEFDIVYVGSTIDGYPTKTLGSDQLYQTVTDYTDNNMDGLVYTNVGDTVRSGGANGYNYSGLLDRDYYSSTYIDATSNAYYYYNNYGHWYTRERSSADLFRFSGNDLTEKAMNELKDFAAAGHPVVLADDLFNTTKGESKYLEDGSVKRNWDKLSLFSRSFSYSITASKSTLTVAPTGTWADDVIDDILGIFGSKYTSAQIKAYIEKPQCHWYYYNSSTGSNGASIDNYTSNVLNIAAFPSGTFFLCEVEIKPFGLSNWVCDPFAQTQGVDLTNNAVNTERVDKYSYMYQFLDSLKGKSGTFSEGLLSPACGGTVDAPGASALSERQTLAALVNISNPSVVFETDSKGTVQKPLEYAMTTTVSTDKTTTTTMNTLTPAADGKYYLDYAFHITNPTDYASSTTYTCKLFVDSNGDGRFTDDEALDGVELSLDGRAVQSSALRASRSDMTFVYRIHRPLADEISGVIPWKLEIVQNDKPGIHASQTGFTHITGQGISAEKHKTKQINVLQVYPSNGNNADLNSTAYQDDFALIKNDYSITLTQKPVSELNAWPSKAAAVGATDAEKIYNAYLKEQNMLVLGFVDEYKEMTPATAQAIQMYISTGKAVLFSHDCASFVSTPYTTAGSAGSGMKQYDSYTYKTANVYVDGDVYGYNFNLYLRDAVGLDRYGVSSAKTAADAGKFGQTAMNGQTTTSGFVANNNGGSGLTGAQTAALQAGGYSIARDPVTGKTVPETQGLTNAMLMRYWKSGGVSYGYANAQSDGRITVGSVTQVNRGQITTYPFDVNTKSFGGTNANLKSTDKMSVSSTHLQYQQLNMNSDDIVVWYCLSGSVYDNMTNDVMNQYYIYTRGNITYTGSGHAGGQTDYERMLFVNTIIAAYRHSQTAPTAAFTDSTGGKSGVKSILVPSDSGDLLTPNTTAANAVASRIYFKLKTTSLSSTDLTKTYSAVLGVKIGDTSTPLVKPAVMYYDDSGTLQTADLAKLDPKYVYFVSASSILSLDTVQAALKAGSSVSFYVTPTLTTTSKSGTPGIYTGDPVTIPVQKVNLFPLG